MNVPPADLVRRVEHLYGCTGARAVLDDLVARVVLFAFERHGERVEGRGTTTAEAVLAAAQRARRLWGSENDPLLV